MDVLVALGSSVAYVYSAVVTLGLITTTTATNSMNVMDGQAAAATPAAHVYFETAAVIITLIVLGKLLEVRAKGRTSEAIKNSWECGQKPRGLYGTEPRVTFPSRTLW